MPVVHPEESLEMELGMSADGIWKRLEISEGGIGKGPKMSADEIQGGTVRKRVSSSVSGGACMSVTGATRTVASAEPSVPFTCAVPRRARI